MLGTSFDRSGHPWLVIDPKPFAGDPAYDATQHLFNCEARLRSDPGGTMNRMADLLEVDRERVRLWMFARGLPPNLVKTWRTDDRIALEQRRLLRGDAAKNITETSIVPRKNDKPNDQSPRPYGHTVRVPPREAGHPPRNAEDRTSGRLRTSP